MIETDLAWPAQCTDLTGQDKGQCGCQTFLLDHSYNLGRTPLYSFLVAGFVKAGIWQIKESYVTCCCQALVQSPNPGPRVLIISKLKQTPI